MVPLHNSSLHSDSCWSTRRCFKNINTGAFQKPLNNNNNNNDNNNNNNDNNNNNNDNNHGEEDDDAQNDFGYEKEVLKKDNK